jgi:hypothetical protein
LIAEYNTYETTFFFFMHQKEFSKKENYSIAKYYDTPKEEGQIK